MKLLNIQYLSDRLVMQISIQNKKRFVISLCRFPVNLKGTLMQIWKSPCMFLFIQKHYPEDFAFLILRILGLYTRQICVMFVYKHTEIIEHVKK